MFHDGGNCRGCHHCPEQFDWSSRAADRDRWVEKWGYKLAEFWEQADWSVIIGAGGRLPHPRWLERLRFAWKFRACYLRYQQVMNAPQIIQNTWKYRNHPIKYAKGGKIGFFKRAYDQLLKKPPQYTGSGAKPICHKMRGGSHRRGKNFYWRGRGYKEPEMCSTCGYPL